MLPHAAIGVARERHPTENRRGRAGPDIVFRCELHAVGRWLADEVRDISGAVDPKLFPPLSARVVDVKAASGVLRALASPMLGYDAAIVFTGDRAETGQVVRAGHIGAPFADPKVEGAVCVGSA